MRPERRAIANSRLTLLPDEELLLAHHRDDQMETLLLRLIRGSGSRGLSGIPRSRVLGASRLLRPLLDIDREELQSYAESEQLIWVEDHSNKDEGFDRNYCRHTLLPLIEARWPEYRQSWSKSAVLASESEALLQELAAIDLAQIAAVSKSIVSREKLLALVGAKAAQCAASLACRPRRKGAGLESAAAAEQRGLAGC